MEAHCIIDTTHSQNRHSDSYWVECVRVDKHNCQTKPRKLFIIPRFTDEGRG
jgi:hypothetical protein